MTKKSDQYFLSFIVEMKFDEVIVFPADFLDFRHGFHVPNDDFVFVTDSQSTSIDVHRSRISAKGRFGVNVPFQLKLFIGMNLS